MAGELGLLCHKHGGNRLCYKHGGAALVYKAASGDWTQISFAWGSEGKDLDICAYWDGAPSLQMGYGHNTSTTEQVSGVYHIFYSGDIQGTDASEWVKIKMSPWSSGARTFKVHFNFYGYNASTYPGNSCQVIAVQMNGGTRIVRNVTCSTRSGSAAQTSDPGVRITFDAKGNLTNLEVI